MHLDVFERRIETRLKDALKRVFFLKASKRVQICGETSDASFRCIQTRLDSFFLGKIILFAQIAAASSSCLHDDHLFYAASNRTIIFIFIHTLKLCGERG
jgi:hypothetical protein